MSPQEDHYQYSTIFPERTPSKASRGQDSYRGKEPSWAAAPQEYLTAFPEWSFRIFLQPLMRPAPEPRGTVGKASGPQFSSLPPRRDRTVQPPGFGSVPSLRGP